MSSSLFFLVFKNSRGFEPSIFAVCNINNNVMIGCKRNQNIPWFLSRSLIFFLSPASFFGLATNWWLYTEYLHCIHGSLASSQDNLQLLCLFFRVCVCVCLCVYWTVKGGNITDTHTQYLHKWAVMAIMHHNKYVHHFIKNNSPSVPYTLFLSHKDIIGVCAYLVYSPICARNTVCVRVYL